MRADNAIDPDGHYHRACRALADETGAAVDEVIEEWTERAGVRLYCGGLERADADRLAFDDVCDRYRRQRSLL